MVDREPLDTQRYVTASLTPELSSAGFENADEIGHGGFGVVYRCTQSALDRTVAVKVLTADLDEENRERFFREQRAMGRLTGHPNIVNVLQVGATDSDRPFIVMPYLSQDSLDTRIRRDGPLALDEALRLGVKIAGAVESAHRLNILHRDVKPANILFTDYGEPALTDFGIAHISGGFETATGTITGSPAFIAPEVLRGDPPSAASDIYGLGATVFAAVTGHAAFERRQDEQVIAQFLRITAQPIPNLREKGFPEDLCVTIERAMSGDPQERPLTAAELGEELRQVQLRNGFPVDEMALANVPGAPEHHRDRPGPEGAGDTSARRYPPVVATPRRGSAGNLPLELTSFIGRRRELTEVKKRLSSWRLVTLTGIGGVGKTRLALRAATNAQRTFPDGVWLVELGEVRDQSLVIDVVAAALGLKDQPARSLQAVVVEFLASRDLLLMLDNCEQVVEAVAELAETLLRSCPRVRILATSREPLGIGGETVVRVPPLDAPDPGDEPTLEGMPRFDAVTLFTERAVEAVPEFILTDTNRGAVAGICRQLDGLPLAIELAAARLRAMSAEQILQRLTDRYALLTTGSRRAPTRQQTLRLCIDWSYELCTEQEQSVWRRLSVFAGSFELDAAEEVGGHGLAPQDLLDSLTSLVDKSILIREQRASVVRFRMLETLRDYGREKAENIGEHLEQARRHRDWYQQLALEAEADWVSSRQLEWISRLEWEQPNLREALEFSLFEKAEEQSVTALRIAGTLFTFWLSRNLLSEGRYWLGRALAHGSTRPTEERVKALYAASVLAELQSDLDSAASLVEEGQALAKQMNDPVVNACIAHAEGLLALYSGDLPRASTKLEAAYDEFHTRGDLSLEAWILMMLGLAYELRGDLAQAISYHEKVLAITEPRGESVFRSYSLWAMGVAVFRQGDFPRAALLLEQCLRLARPVDEPLLLAMCLEAVAWVTCADGRAEHAGVLLGAAEVLGSGVGSSSVLFHNLVADHEQCERSAVGALGQQAFETVREQGRALTAEKAIAYALGEQPAATSRSSDGTVHPLTRREREVADMVAQGFTNKKIAAELVISPRTAQGHVEHILEKLGFNSRSQIAAWVVERTKHA
ncbi:protein kinase [Rhodococcus opacus]|uniref:Protein kinase n=1 Tax=Rhodococcus opacus TaxID=37919 RepID=A0ABT4NSV4_RHOOP|nr:protein kinase [Rhodococcus opacus]MCZ4590470.1 protein kinase [Rhodococcus opacus]MDV7087579.1 protein kinase [Rhodococcus opacus]